MPDLGCHDPLASGAVPDHSVPTRCLGGPPFCRCHSSSSTFLCHFICLLYGVVVVVVVVVVLLVVLGAYFTTERR